MHHDHFSAPFVQYADGCCYVHQETHKSNPKEANKPAFFMPRILKIIQYHPQSILKKRNGNLLTSI
jgi:hypothetical protein